MFRLAQYIFLIIIPITFFSNSFQEFPSQPTGHVNDYADLLSPTDEQRLETKLRTYRDTTSNVIALAIVESLQGLPREEVATTLFNEWRMWEGDRQNGVLFLIAPNEREMQIEVGYGLEGAVTDLQAGRIVDEILAPRFRNNDFYGGLDQATTTVMRLAAGEFDAIESASDDSSPVLTLFTLFIIFIVIYSLFRAGTGGKGGGRRRHTLGSGGPVVWGGGFSGGGSSGGLGGGGFGGFGGGGGFGSGGAGAGGSW